MRRLLTFLVMGLSSGALLAPAVNAQYHGTGRPPAEERFRSPQRVLDRRFHHDHYYPATGYVVAALPAGHSAITFGGAPFLLSGRCLVPARARRLRGGDAARRHRRPHTAARIQHPFDRGAPYDDANDIFYVPAPSGGFMVVAPPPGVENATVQAVEGGGPPPAPPMSPPMASPPAPAAPATAYWYYCASAQTYYPHIPSCPEPWVKVPPTPQQVPVAPPRS